MIRCKISGLFIFFTIIIEIIMKKIRSSHSTGRTALM